MLTESIEIEELS